jgi:hypothetical protein
LAAAASTSWLSTKSTRLTRSLADFARLVEIFDARGRQNFLAPEYYQRIARTL